MNAPDLGLAGGRRSFVSDDGVTSVAVRHVYHQDGARMLSTDALRRSRTLARPRSVAPKWRTYPFIVAVGALLATSAFGAEVSPACAPLVKAMEKSLAADHNAVTVASGTTSHGVTVSGVMYFQIQGAWKKSRLSPQDSINQSRENLRNSKVYSCKTLPDSTVAGVTAINYQAHSENEYGTTDSTISVAKSSGLALRVENNLNLDGKPRSYVTTYSYDNVHAPAM